jgi:nucleoside-diphosphate-sugar epimerase
VDRANWTVHPDQLSVDIPQAGAQGPVHRVAPRHNPFLPCARSKIAAENVIRAAYEETQFPATIVRPSHTYDDAECWL